MNQLRAAVLAIALLALLGLAGPAFAGAPYKPEKYALTEFFTSASDTTAGGHPNVRAKFALDYVGVENTWEVFGRTRRVEIDMPYGLVGDPTNFPTCSRAQFQTKKCPPQSQVGVADIVTGHQYRFEPRGVFNLEPGPNAPARFGILLEIGVIYSFIDVETRADGGLRAVVKDINAASPLLSSDVTLWGVPYDENLCNPNHPDYVPGMDNPYDRTPGPCPTSDPADWERLPFMSAPTECSRRPETRLRVFSYEGYSDRAVSYDKFPTDCESLEFDPSISVSPSDRSVDGVSGLDVAISIPQSNDPDGRATAHLKDARVTLPEGVSINPGLARGLQACSNAAFGEDTEAPAACPAASKVGSLSVDTPLLDVPLPGDIYVGQPMPGNRYRLFLNIEGKGVRVKLAGSVRPDPVTGQITTVFADNPPMPFSKMSLHFQAGPRGVLAMPPSCGVKTSTASFTPYSGTGPVLVSDSFGVSWDGAGAACPSPLPFRPGLAGGSEVATGGAFSPFAVSFTKPDGHQTLSKVNVELPDGLLADLRHVPLCADHLADRGACPVESRIGKVTVGSGPGGSPFFVDGSVALTGPYENAQHALPGVEGADDPAPYGLAVAVRAIAGPYDLGTVVVRQSIHVDPDTAEVTVISDPLPTILEGIPLRIQRIDVDVNRPGFTRNPTSCEPNRLRTVFGSTLGAVAEQAVRYQAADCDQLAFDPKLRMRLIGRGQRKTGGNPALKAVLRQPGEQAGVDRARVVLPRSIALDPDNSTDPKMLCDHDAAMQRSECPKSTIIGRAVARTPILKEPLRGPVHLVQGIRVDKDTGNRIRTTPHLLVKLDGEVRINLRAKTTAKNGLLITRFLGVPDAPVNRFAIRIKGGDRKGILTVTRTRRSEIDLCDRRQIARAQLRGQNGKRASFRTRVRTPCGGKAGNARRGTRANAKRKATKRRASARRAAERSGR